MAEGEVGEDQVEGVLREVVDWWCVHCCGGVRIGRERERNYRERVGEAAVKGGWQSC